MFDNLDIFLLKYLLNLFYYIVFYNFNAYFLNVLKCIFNLTQVSDIVKDSLQIFIKFSFSIFFMCLRRDSNPYARL